MATIPKAFSFGCARIMTERDARNLRVFNRWFVAAMLLFAASTVVLTERWVTDVAAGGVLAGATILVLAIAVASYQRFLREADELLRKIQIEGLAAGFGAGALFMIGWRLCERIGAPRLDVDDPLLVMVVAWGLGQWIGVRRYMAEGEES